MKRLLALFCLAGLLITGCSRTFQGELVDLTLLNETMLNARYNSIMINDSKSYVGHNIKIRGPYQAVEISDAGVTVHSVLTKEGGGCCAGRFDFVMRENEYPPEGSIVELTGVFTRGPMQNGEPYYYLAADEFVVVE